MTRLLVVRLSALGDVIHTIPAIVSLRRDHEITWVVEAPYRELVEIVAGVRTIPVRMKRWTREPSAMFASLRAMRRAGADVSIDFQGLIKSAMLPWAAGVKTRVGFASDAIREKPALLFTNRKVRVDTTRHVIEQNAELAGVQELAAGNWRELLVEVPGVRGGDIVLLPGAGKPNKLWPVDRFRELARRIGDRALAVWGPGERDRAEAIGARVAPPTSLRELAWLLANAQLVVGADTGPLHLAAALGTKVVGLYGPTDPRRNGPYGQLDHCVDKFRTTKWMESISVEEVMNLVQRVAAE
jgi:lipopolysaccharide heptosyltransferase I